MPERINGMAAFVEMKEVHKVYQMGEIQISAADGIDFSIEKGEFVVIVGPSGAGKTTVLNILGGMDRATSGEIWENVELALQICKNPLNAEQVLCQVGLKDRLKNFPAQLSGGEQQRVAIARALAKNPKLLLCDEPTGALDYQTGKSILKLLQDTCREMGMTVIVITHNSAIAPMADRIIEIKNGRVNRIRQNQYPQPVEEIEW